MAHDAPAASPELEPIHVILPMRTVSGGKARLGEALDPEEREELILGLLLHALSVLSEWPRCGRLHLVSPDPALERVARPDGIEVAVHRQADEGLNEGVRLGVAAAISDGAASALVLPGDLPHLSVEALERLVLAADAGLAAAEGRGVVAIAPSDARNGTNALLLHPPDVIEPHFGSDSLEAHLRAADGAGVAVQIVGDGALGFDLDTPEDLERLEPGRLRDLMAAGRRAADGAAV
jgi:2-phospho-L-lactate guanylyltransferase